MLNNDDKITTYTIDEQDNECGIWQKQIAKLHEKRKYARRSATNYNDRVKYRLAIQLFAFSQIQMLEAVETILTNSMNQ